MSKYFIIKLIYCTDLDKQKVQVILNILTLKKDLLLKCRMGLEMTFSVGYRCHLILSPTAHGAPWMAFGELAVWLVNWCCGVSQCLFYLKEERQEIWTRGDT